MKRIVLLTVHFHNEADIKSLAANLSALRVPSGWQLEIVVVDNSGGMTALSGVTVFRPGSNLGYLGGIAFGVEQIRSRDGGAIPEWIGIVNPDVSFAPEALEQLLLRDYSETIAAVAPSILLGGSVPQNPFLAARPSRLRMWLYTIMFRSSGLTRLLDLLLSLKRTSLRVEEEERAIYAPHGSAILLRALFWQRGGTLEYRGFMYGEEIHIAEQIARAGSKVLYVPGVKAVHRGSSTTSRTASHQRRRWHLESAQILWEDYFR